MKDLLNSIKTQLQTDLTYVRDSDIYVTEDERLIPQAVKFPAVGLKDGEVLYVIETGDQETDELYVKAIAYVQLQKPGAAIMGDTATGKKGVLEIIADIKASLNDEKFSGTYESAIPVSEPESEFLADEETAIQMKSIIMRYTKLVT